MQSRVRRIGLSVGGALFLLAFLLVLAPVQAQGPVPFTEDFAGFTGAGFAPNPTSGQLDSDTWIVKGLSAGDLDFGDTGTSGDYARGSSAGGVSTGGVYAFNTGGGNTILGVQPGGSDWTPGDFRLKLQNGTGTAITQLDISYEIWVLNNTSRANSLNF